MQLSIDASHEMMEEKWFSKEKKGNIENLKLVKTESGNIKKKLPDLEDRSRRRNLCLDGITECKNEWWIKNTKKNSLMNNYISREQTWRQPRDHLTEMAVVHEQLKQSLLLMKQRNICFLKPQDCFSIFHLIATLNMSKNFDSLKYLKVNQTNPCNVIV